MMRQKCASLMLVDILFLVSKIVHPPAGRYMRMLAAWSAGITAACSKVRICIRRVTRGGTHRWSHRHTARVHSKLTTSITVIPTSWKKERRVLFKCQHHSSATLSTAQPLTDAFGKDFITTLRFRSCQRRRLETKSIRQRRQQMIKIFKFCTKCFYVKELYVVSLL